MAFKIAQNSVTLSKVLGRRLQLVITWHLERECSELKHGGGLFYGTPSPPPTEPCVRDGGEWLLDEHPT